MTSSHSRTAAPPIRLNGSRNSVTMPVLIETIEKASANAVNGLIVRLSCWP
jgi:hypothetical protein